MIRINLLPSKKAKKRKDTGQQQLLVFFLLVLISGGGLFYWYTQVEEQIETLTNQVNAKKKQLDTLRKQAGDLTELENREKSLKERLKQIDDLQKSRVGPVRMLAELSRRIPGRVWVNLVTEKDHRMKIIGAGLSYDDVAEFKRGLRESGYFINIQDGGQEEKPSPIPGLNFVEFKLDCDTKYAIPT